jgi:hypothetical protein
MRTRTAVIAALMTGAVALAPVAGANAAKPDPKPEKAQKSEKPAFAVTKLSLGGKKTVDVTDEAATVKVRVQVKDKSGTFDPAKVRLSIVEKVTGEENVGSVVTAKLAGKSKKVSNWVGKVTIPQDSVAAGTEATYCVKLVKVVADDTSAEPVVATAKGLKGRDCVTVVNSDEVDAL